MTPDVTVLHPVAAPRCTFVDLAKGDCSQPVVRDAAGRFSRTKACYYHEKVLNSLLGVARLADYNECPRFQEVRGAQLVLNKRVDDARFAARAAGR